MTDRVLLGYTGFVGQNLLRQRPFDLCVNRSNIADLKGVHADLLVVSAMPAEKWRANQNPDEDLANLRRLQASLTGVSAKRVVLISTVDVYPHPHGVDEDATIKEALQQPYGAHRLRLEQWVRERFERCTIVRLPGLFGPGLKKNVLFDLLHGHQTQLIHMDAQFQWYPIMRLAEDIEQALAHDLSCVNAAVEPVRTKDIVDRFFPGMDLQAQPQPPARYGITSRHSALFGGQSGFWLSRDQVLESIGEWILSEGGAHAGGRSA